MIFAGGATGFRSQNSGVRRSYREKYNGKAILLSIRLPRRSASGDAPRNDCLFTLDSDLVFRLAFRPTHFALFLHLLPLSSSLFFTLSAFVVKNTLNYKEYFGSPRVPRIFTLTEPSGLLFPPASENSRLSLSAALREGLIFRIMFRRDRARLSGSS